jgi:hypothetical protein
MVYRLLIAAGARWPRESPQTPQGRTLPPCGARDRKAVRVSPYRSPHIVPALPAQSANGKGFAGLGYPSAPTDRARQQAPQEAEKCIIMEQTILRRLEVADFVTFSPYYLNRLYYIVFLRHIHINQLWGPVVYTFRLSIGQFHPLPPPAPGGCSDPPS